MVFVLWDSKKIDRLDDIFLVSWFSLQQARVFVWGLRPDISSSGFPFHVLYFDMPIFEGFVLFFIIIIFFTKFLNRIWVNSSLAWETDSWVPETLEIAFLDVLFWKFPGEHASRRPWVLCCLWRSQMPCSAKNAMSGAFRNMFTPLQNYRKPCLCSTVNVTFSPHAFASI